MFNHAAFSSFLKSQPTNQVTLTFRRIEQIGGTLPPSARTYLRWWDNTPGSSEANARLAAGFKVVMVDLEKEQVRLRR
jgi:hypothetical protein